MAQIYNFSASKRRNAAYTRLIQEFDAGTSILLADVVKLGESLMLGAKLHAHFFDDNSLRANAQYLACFALNLPYDQHNNSMALTLTQVIKICSLFESRINSRMPVEYITKQAFYMGHKFYVNAHVLVPRSLMSSRFADFLSKTHWQNYRVLDLCCGSGCIGITLALLDARLCVDLVDLSPEALQVAAINIALHGLGSRVQCIKSDLFQNLSNKYDLIITNPPYVSTSDYRRVPLEFKAEPKMSLESGRQGLDILQQIIKQAPAYLNPQGLIIAEVGYPAAKLLKKYYKHLAFTWLGYLRAQSTQSWFARWLKPWFAMDCIFVWQPNINLFK